jgi:hypothetical protein
MYWAACASSGLYSYGPGRLVILKLPNVEGSEKLE